MFGEVWWKTTNYACLVKSQQRKTLSACLRRLQRNTLSACLRRLQRILSVNYATLYKIQMYLTKFRSPKNFQFCPPFKPEKYVACSKDSIFFFRIFIPFLFLFFWIRNIIQLNFFVSKLFLYFYFLLLYFLKTIYLLDDCAHSNHVCISCRCTVCDSCLLEYLSTS